jgi:hypothetical protein
MKNLTNKILNSYVIGCHGLSQREFLANFQSFFSKALWLSKQRQMRTLAINVTLNINEHMEIFTND